MTELRHDLTATLYLQVQYNMCTAPQVLHDRAETRLSTASYLCCIILVQLSSLIHAMLPSARSLGNHVASI